MERRRGVAILQQKRKKPLDFLLDGSVSETQSDVSTNWIIFYVSTLVNVWKWKTTMGKRRDKEERKTKGQQSEMRVVAKKSLRPEVFATKFPVRRGNYDKLAIRPIAHSSQKNW